MHRDYSPSIKTRHCELAGIGFRLGPRDEGQRLHPSGRSRRCEPTAYRLQTLTPTEVHTHLPASVLCSSETRRLQLKILPRSMQSCGAAVDRSPMGLLTTIDTHEVCNRI